MKIILVGAHGTGKSTLAKDLQKHYKWPVIESASRDIRGLVEKERQEIRRQTGHLAFLTDQDIHKIITAMNIKLWRDTEISSRRVPHIYTRTLIDNIAYSEPEEWNEMLDVLKTFDFEDAIFLRIPIEFGIENDGVRYTGQEYQERVSDNLDLILKKMIEAGKISENQIYHISGSPEERLESAMDYIEDNMYLG